MNKYFPKNTPDSAKIFLTLGLSLSVMSFLFVNDWSETFSSFDFLIKNLSFLIFGLVLSIFWTSIHWLFYYYKSANKLDSIQLTVSGILMLLIDSYIRISSTFFAKSSTAPIAVVFIPIIAGVLGIVSYIIVERVCENKSLFEGFKN